MAVQYDTVDVEALLQRIAALETENTHLRNELEQISWDQTYQQLQLFRSLVERSLDGIMVTLYDKDGTPYMAYTNPALGDMLGFGAEFNQSHIDHINALDPEVYNTAPRITLETGSWRGVQILQKKDGTPLPGLVSAYYYHLDEDKQQPVLAVVFRDITDLHQSEAARARLQAELIAAQQALIRELSTPLIPIADRVVIMPLIGSIDSTRAQAVIETLLEGITTHRAETAILDITGVQTIDSQVASALVQATQAVRLLGARVMVTGIHPAIAQTLVHLGVDLQGIATYSALQAGIAAALRSGAAPTLRNGTAARRNPLLTS
ncbi:MAG: STAS domain-containing protein [Chloroflexaceae bacterium]|nr:STAS domain-containing protein [Chloroflexaceae bacterium]NJO08110.1 STAS domain-containing protein [Chloroflexaceae bacterium]